MFGEMQLAEGEELESNILQVGPPSKCLDNEAFCMAIASRDAPLEAGPSRGRVRIPLSPPNPQVSVQSSSVRATTFESTPLAFSCVCGGVERTHQCASVLFQNVIVDILDRVTGPMIAGIVRETSCTAEQAGLSL